MSRLYALIGAVLAVVALAFLLTLFGAGRYTDESGLGLVIGVVMLTAGALTAFRAEAFLSSRR